MNKKREKLEKILWMLRKWAEEYDEPYVTMCVFNERGEDNFASVHIDVGRPDDDAMRIRIDYNAPGAATPRALR